MTRDHKRMIGELLEEQELSGCVALTGQEQAFLGRLLQRKRTGGSLSVNDSRRLAVLYKKRIGETEATQP